jgi:glutathionylspermidine synthase
MNAPREPSAELRKAASQLHQMFIALLQEGFTEAQALQVVAAILQANGGGKT